MYVNRIDDFFELGLSVSQQTWRIREKEEVLGGDFIVLIWSMDVNDPSNQGCLGRDFTPVYSVITVHEKRTGALTDYNASILPVGDSACRMDEINISSTVNNSFQISIGSMMAAGGWGAPTHRYRFDIISDALVISSFNSIYIDRSGPLFEELIIDFITGNMKSIIQMILIEQWWLEATI